MEIWCQKHDPTIKFDLISEYFIFTALCVYLCMFYAHVGIMNKFILNILKLMRPDFVTVDRTFLYRISRCFWTPHN